MRARWLAGGLALVLGGVTMAWFARETEPEPVAYDWSVVMTEQGYAEDKQLARGYPASALPPEQQEHCPVRIVALPGDPLIARAHLVITVYYGYGPDPYNRNDYTIYDGPARSEIQVTKPIYMRGYQGEIWVRAFVDEGRRYKQWTTFGSGGWIDCAAGGAVLNLLGYYDKEAGDRTLRVDPMPGQP